MNYKVYKIISPANPDLVYYGSTSKKYLSERLAQHKGDFKRFPTSKRAVYELIKFNDAKIELVEETTKENYKIREQYYIDNYNCVNKINAYLPGSNKEKLKNWKINNPEKQKQHLKNYYELHKNERVICEQCNIELNKNCLSRHNKRAHS